jgi:hypothetical protein
VVIEGPATIVTDNTLEAVPPAESVTLKVIEAAPAAVDGVPLMVPVEASSASHAGNVPDVMLQV